MNYLNDIRESVSRWIESVTEKSFDANSVGIDFCKREFEGDFTILIFPSAKLIGKAPEQIAQQCGDYLLAESKISNFNVVKGFLNISLPDSFWLNELEQINTIDLLTRIRKNCTPSSYLIEFCSPNTNKPLHLGHIRNIAIGWSNYKILKALGHDVDTTQVINDRGIAICKSMLAWKKFGNGETPTSTSMKGDHFVGQYYVLFENKFRQEYSEWQQTEQAKTLFSNISKTDSETDFFKEYKNDYFNQYSLLGKEAKEMLLAWEAGDQEVRALWSRMNQWVYEGFGQTFEQLGVRFDSNYYESETYLLGKDIVDDGLKRGVFYRNHDQSVWIDLTDVGLDKKIILRSDGTSVYITQDLGTAVKRHEHFKKQNYVYVVGDEQDYHFKVLFETLKKLNVEFSAGLRHLSYGMVELTTGKMKSREGTIVDADDLMQEVIEEAREGAMERGELAELSLEEKNQIFYKIGMSALKYFILKVNYKKRMIFNPKESVDMQGNTGPYIVNAYVRIQSILRKAGEVEDWSISQISIHPQEKVVITQLLEYPSVLQETAELLDPSKLANYCYALAKDFHKYYHDCRILNAETQELKKYRIALCKNVSQTLEHGMECLGISMPERM